jgi:hypothetical protein
VHKVVVFEASKASTLLTGGQDYTTKNDYYSSHAKKEDPRIKKNDKVP